MEPKPHLIALARAGYDLEVILVLSGGVTVHGTASTLEQAREAAQTFGASFEVRDAQAPMAVFNPAGVYTVTATSGGLGHGAMRWNSESSVFEVLDWKVDKAN